MSDATEGPSLPASLNLDPSRPLLKASPPRATLPPTQPLVFPSPLPRAISRPPGPALTQYQPGHIRG